MFTKISASLPKELVASIEEARRKADLSFSAMIAEVLRQGLREQTEVPVLQEQVAALEAALAAANAELAIRPEIDSRDYLLSLPPGTSAVADDLQWSEQQRRQLEVDLRDATREAEEWQKSSAIWERYCEAARAEAAQAKKQKVELGHRLTHQRREIDGHEQALRQLEVKHQGELTDVAQFHQRVGWWSGAIVATLATCIAALLLLLLWPADRGAMRFIATVAMGETGDR